MLLGGRTRRAAFWKWHRPFSLLDWLAHRNEAERHWERAVSLQDSFVHDEPPARYYPIRESQGALLLQTGPLRRRLSFERA